MAFSLDLCKKKTNLCLEYLTCACLFFFVCDSVVLDWYAKILLYGLLMPAFLESSYHIGLYLFIA